MGGHQGLTWKSDSKFKTQENELTHVTGLTHEYCDTMVQVHDVLWCAKIQYHTYIHGTHFGSTAGKPVP